MIATVLAQLALFTLFVIYHAWCQIQWSQERQRLNNALLARTPAEFIALERERVRSPIQREQDEHDADLEPVGWSG